MTTTENYVDVNIDDISIKSRRGIIGTEEDGFLEVYEIIGSKKGLYKGEQGKWMTGMYYDPDEYTYEKAMSHWQKTCLPKFDKVA